MKSPIYNVKAIPIERIIPGFYTSTVMTDDKLDLLYKSIKEDGYTSPIVCFYDEALDAYGIIDGYYRYRVMTDHVDIYEREEGLLPVCIIDKPLANLVVSVYRHNMSRGIPDVHFTSMLVRKLVDLGKSSDYIKRHLNINDDLLSRFKNIKSITDMFAEDDTFDSEEEKEKILH